MAKDPVCKMNVDEKTAKYTSEINENKIYLCSGFMQTTIRTKSFKIWILR